jgi:hypothetical protein
VAVADLNADGRLDLVTANFVGTVSVLLGNGDGTFGAKTDFATGFNAYSVAIADLNSDGRPDLVTANYGSNTVSVLLGNGDGTFGGKTDFGTGIGPVSVAVADINADGRSDLAVANHGGGGTGSTVSVLLGNGDGTFGGKTDFGTGIGPLSVAIADFNADGRPDLAVANYYSSQTVSVLRGNGDGTFGPSIDYAAGAYASVAVGDLNADGQPDLVAARPTVTVLLSAPRCPQTPPMSVDFSPNTLDLRSRGLWVTVTLEPEPPASPADIDIASILLNGSVPVDVSAPTSIGDVDHDGRPDLTVKVNRATLELTAPDGDAVPVTVGGTTGNGCFEASNMIRVVHVPVTAPSAGKLLQSGHDAEVRWDTPAGIQVQSVAVLSSLDDGVTWDLVAHELPNTGSCSFVVPGTATDQARIAVVLVESADASGFDVTGVLGMSGRFAITTLVAVGAPHVELALLGSVPNPSRDLSVSFTLPDAKPAKLVAYDVSGRKVSRREVGSLGAGRHIVTLGAPERLATGIYFVQLIQGDRRLVARAVVAQ